MTSLAYGKGTYRRLASGLPELRLINTYVEAAATSQDAIVLLGRPGLVADTSFGSGPIRGLFHEPGVLNDALFTVSGSSLYGASLLGDVAGSGPVSFAASATEMLVAAGAGLTRTDGASSFPVTFPDGAPVTAVAYLGGYFLALRAGTHRFYWSAVRDGSSWDALDYASAESSPDPLLDVVVIGDVIWLLGASTVEPWQPTGGTDLPFSRVEGRNYQRGVRATGCATQLDNALFWIGDDNRVYRGGAVPDGLSDAGIEERIAGSETAAVFAFEHEGHKFLCIRLDAETIAYDVATQEWCEFQTYGRANWQVRCAAQYRGQPRFGDDAAGQLLRFDTAAFSDAGTPLLRLFTAFQPANDGSYSLDVIHLDADMGTVPALQGSAADPVVEIRSSRDGGKTWSGWRQTTLGRQGQYRARAMWRRFGSFDAPGGLFEIRCTDAVRFRVSAVRANEAQGGRSR